MGPKLQLFLHLVALHRLDDRHDEIRQWRELAEAGCVDEQMAELLVYQVQEFINGNPRPNRLPRAPQLEELYPRGAPDLVIGHLSERPEVPVGLFVKGPIFSIFTGQTGYGKTTSQRALILQIIEYNKRHPDAPITLFIIQIRAGDFSDIVSLVPDKSVYFDTSHGPLLGLNAPRGVLPRHWVHDIVTSLCARSGLQYGGITLAAEILWLLAHLNPDGAEPLVWPDFQMLLDLNTIAPPGLFSAKADYNRSLLQVLEGVCLGAGDCTATSNGLDLQRDVIDAGKWVCVISLAQLSPPWLTGFILDILGMQLLHYCAANEHRPGWTDKIMVVDEADSYVSAMAEAAFPSGMGVCSRLFRLGRLWGIGVVLGLGEMALAARHVLGSASHHFVFSLKHSADVIAARDTLRLQDRAEDIIPALEPGEAVIRLPGTWSYAMLAQMDYVQTNTKPAPQCSPSPAKPSIKLDDRPDVLEALKKKMAERNASAMRIQKAQNADLGDDASKLLKLATENMWLPVARLWEKMPAVSAGTQKAIVKELADRELAEFEDVRIGRNDQRLILVQPKGWELLGKKVPVIRGRGKVGHVTCAHWVAEYFAAQGLTAELEWLVPASTPAHHADVAVRRADGRYDCVEIVIHCSENVNQHLRVLMASSHVTNAIIVAPQQKQLADLSAAAQRDEALRPHMDRIQFEQLSKFRKEV